MSGNISSNANGWAPGPIGKTREGAGDLPVDHANDPYNNSGVPEPAPLEMADAKMKAKTVIQPKPVLPAPPALARESQPSRPKPSVDSIRLSTDGGAQAQTEVQAIDALIKMANAKQGPERGLVSKRDVMRLPSGPAKKAILDHFEVLLLSAHAGSPVGKGTPRGLEQKTEAWFNLTLNDLRLTKNQLQRGDTIASWANKVAEREIAKDENRALGQYYVGDRTGDGVKDQTDVKAYVQEIQQGPRHRTEGRYENFSR
jgi:hypothetical protein